MWEAEEHAATVDPQTSIIQPLWKSLHFGCPLIRNHIEVASPAIQKTVIWTFHFG